MRTDRRGGLNYSPVSSRQMSITTSRRQQQQSLVDEFETSPNANEWRRASASAAADAAAAAAQNNSQDQRRITYLTSGSRQLPRSDERTAPKTRRQSSNSSSNEDSPPFIDDGEDEYYGRYKRDHIKTPESRRQLTRAAAATPSGDDLDSLSEVYLCNCCGVTRELEPAMRYMPVFKSLFLVSNFLVFAFGLANFGMGLWFRIDPKVYEIHKHIETQNFTIAGWTMLAGGFTAMLMALLGCSATSRQSTSLLLLYCSVMIALTIGSVATLILLTVHGLGIQLERFLTKEMYEQIRRRTMNNELDLFSSSEAAQFMDFVQVKMRCCGAADFRDYTKLGMVIPTTCYTIAGNYINAPGCGRSIRELFDLRAGMATGFVTGSTIVQLLTSILAALMICSIYNWRAQPKMALVGSPTADQMAIRDQTEGIEYNFDNSMGAAGGTHTKQTLAPLTDHEQRRYREQAHLYRKNQLRTPSPSGRSIRI